jgi:hypothetical protein
LLGVYDADGPMNDFCRSAPMLRSPNGCCALLHRGGRDPIRDADKHAPAPVLIAQRFGRSICKVDTGRYGGNTLPRLGDPLGIAEPAGCPHPARVFGRVPVTDPRFWPSGGLRRIGRISGDGDLAEEAWLEPPYPIRQRRSAHGVELRAASARPSRNAGRASRTALEPGSETNPASGAEPRLVLGPVPQMTFWQCRNRR